MNQDERFPQRWEFRSSKDDGGTSSDEEGSNSRGEPTEKKPNTVTDLVLFQNDEASNDLGSHRHDYDAKTVEADDKKTKPSKRKKPVQRKSEGRRVVKEINKKRKHSINEKGMLKDLKKFADSLVHELAVERENMFAHMRDEMKKLVGSKPNRGLIKKNVRLSQNASLQGNTRAVEEERASEAHKGGRVRQSTMANMSSAPFDHQLPSSSSSSYIAIPSSQLQNQRNHFHLINDHVPCVDNKASSGIEICKLMAAKSLSRRFAEFQQGEQFGGFSLNYHKSWGVYGSSQGYTSRGVGFPVPLNQGTDSGSNRSSMSYINDSIRRSPSSSRAVLEGHRGGEFGAARFQGQRDIRFNMSNTK